MTSARAEALRLHDQGRYAEARAVLESWLREAPDNPEALRGLRRLQLLQADVATPDDVAGRVALARTLAGLVGPAAVQGADEGARLQRTIELILPVLDDIPQADRGAMARLLWRLGQYEAAASLGDLVERGRYSALHGDPQTLLPLFSRVETQADRRELLHQHRLWAQDLEQAAAAQPIVRPPTVRRERLRLGILSSDLRHHVIAYFAQPLFEFVDPGFELYAYSSFPGSADVVQPWFEGQTRAFRKLPPDDRAAAQLIAADDLDMLVELGGPTSYSRPGVLAYRPARRQASWLGYPHSLGLSAIDHIIADPFVVPPDRSLLMETPLLMPASWVCMAPAAFGPLPAPASAPPSAANGFITFGTANDPYKFTPRVLHTWARVLAATPGSRFMIVRPEAGAPAFQQAMAAHFAQAGVGAERLIFRPLRGAVRPAYDDIDIALDTFPVTGGTTTCDALWMGVPTVTLAGAAMFERLSLSLLTNAGLADLVADSEEAFVQIAVALAGDAARLADLRQSLRLRIRLSPLGQPERFAADFYDLMAGAIGQP